MNCIKWTFVATLALMQLACATSQEMSSEDRTFVRTVYIDRNVPLPKEPLVQTRGQVLAGTLGGLVGAAIASADKTKEQATIEYLEKNNITIDSLLVDAFTKELATRRTFSVVSSTDEADATINFEILVYGVGQNGNMFSSGYRTILNAKASMNKAGGTVIWVKQVIDAANNGDRPQATFEELYENPEIMRTHMTTVAQRAAKTMVDHLSGSR